MFDDLAKGMGFFWQGMPLIWGKRVRVFAFAPIGLTVLMFIAFVLVGADYFSDFMIWTESKTPSWLSWIDWLGWVVFGSLWTLALFFGFIAAANLVASPFNGLLAEAVEQKLRPPGPPATTWAQLVKRMPTILIQETKKIVYFVILSIPFLLLACFFGPFGALAWATFSAWMLTLQFVDYAMDNNGLPFREMRRRIRKKPWIALGFGGMTLLAFATPFVNLVAMPTAVAGGTIFWNEELRTMSS
ncbi:MAG: sulfate transporter CysZ [Planctomycetota bacterium]